jgi:hypothetical protein
MPPSDGLTSIDSISLCGTNNTVMSEDHSTELRQKAEACRRLADISESAERKALWLKRADEWEKLAIAAQKRR